MTKFTPELVNELLPIQQEFDARIKTINIGDSVMAYFVEVFEWLNAYEKTFKNWKANPGKGHDVEIEELADVTAFALSILSQFSEQVSEEDFEFVLESFSEQFESLCDAVSFDNSVKTLGFISLILQQMYSAGQPEIGAESVSVIVMLPFIIAHNHYTIDELVDAYKSKMEINHARQDGTADAGKGYV